MSILLVGGLEPVGVEGLEFHRALLQRVGGGSRVLHVPAARHDAPSRQGEFRAVYEGQLHCQVDTLELHRRRPEEAEVVRRLAEADLVFLDGGNSAWLMACLGQPYLQSLLQDYARGPKWLLGFSAGANCLHEQGWSAAAGQRPVAGLGILSGGFAPHGANTRRRKALQAHLIHHAQRWLVCADGSALVLRDQGFEVLGPGVQIYDSRGGALEVRSFEDGQQGAAVELYL